MLCTRVSFSIFSNRKSCRKVCMGQSLSPTYIIAKHLKEKQKNPKYDEVEQKKNLLNAFKLLDVSYNGVIDKFEIKLLINSVVESYAKAAAECIDNPELSVIPANRVKELINVVDVDGDGKIDFNEFLALIVKIEGVLFDNMLSDLDTK